MEINRPHGSKRISVGVQLILKFHVRSTIHSMVKSLLVDICGYELPDILFCYLWWQHYGFPFGSYLTPLSVHVLLIGLGHALRNDWCKESHATNQRQGDPIPHIVCGNTGKKKKSFFSLKVQAVWWQKSGTSGSRKLEPWNICHKERSRVER